MKVTMVPRGYRTPHGGALPATRVASQKFKDSAEFAAAAGALPLTTHNYQTCVAAGLATIEQTTGLCTNGAAAYALTCCAILSGQPCVNQSSLFGYWGQRWPNNTNYSLGGGTVPGGLASIMKPGTTGSPYIAGPGIGSCEEALWSMGMTLAPLGVDNQPYINTALGMTPDPAVMADAGYHYINSFALLDWDATDPNFFTAMKTALAVGYPICFANSNHAWCALDYDDTDGAGVMFALSSHGNAGPVPGLFGFPYADVVTQLGEFFVVTSVSVSRAPSANINFDAVSFQAILAQMMGANGMPNPMTVTMWNQLEALMTAAGATPIPYPPPAPPPPTPGPPATGPVSPDRTTSPPASGVNDGAGGLWTVSGTQVMKNSVAVGGGGGADAQLVGIFGGTIYYQSIKGQWYSRGGGWWNGTKAP